MYKAKSIEIINYNSGFVVGVHITFILNIEVLQ